MTKLLILPNFSGWYYFSTHRGTKYHFFYKLSYKSFCGSVTFNDRKNDKHLHRRIDNMADWRICKQCYNKFIFDRALSHIENIQQAPPYRRPQLRSNFSKKVNNYYKPRPKYTWQGWLQA